MDSGQIGSPQNGKSEATFSHNIMSNFLRIMSYDLGTLAYEHLQGEMFYILV